MTTRLELCRAAGPVNREPVTNSPLGSAPEEFRQYNGHMLNDLWRMSDALFTTSGRETTDAAQAARVTRIPEGDRAARPEGKGTTVSTWYVVRKYYNDITPVDVVRATEKQVVVLDSKGRERRIAKEGSYDNYFTSFEESRAYLVSRLTAAVNGYRQHLETSTGALKSALAMTPPGSKSEVKE